MVLVFVIWFHRIADRGVLSNLFQVTAVVALAASLWLLRQPALGWSFAVTSVAISSAVLSLFLDLYPRVTVSSTQSAYSLTVQNTASGTYSLQVMTLATVILFPTVVLYQGWTYYVFRERVRTDSFEPAG